MAQYRKISQVNKECFKNDLLQDYDREEKDENENPFPGMSEDEINDMLQMLFYEKKYKQTDYV